MKAKWGTIFFFIPFVLIKFGFDLSLMVPILITLWGLGIESMVRWLTGHCYRSERMETTRLRHTLR